MANAIRPLPALALALILGVWVGSDGTPDPERAALTRALATLALILAVSRATSRGHRPARIGLFTLAAAGLCVGALGVPRQPIPSFDIPIGEDRIIEAELCGLDRGPRGLELVLCNGVDVARAASIPKLLVFADPTPPGDSRGPRWQRGHWYRLEVRFLSAGDPRNPGARGRAFEGRTRRGLAGRARLLDAATATRRPDLESVGGLERAFHAGHARLLDARLRLAVQLSAAGPGGGLVAALALGVRGGVAQQDRSAFARIGIAHVLAVSGLHLVLVIGAVQWGLIGLVSRFPRLLGRFDVRPPVRLAAVIAGCAYAALCGFALPMQRALIFAWAWLIGSLCGRRVAAVEVLACAVVALLWLDPASLFDAGAHLSFCAASALMLARREVAPDSGPGPLDRFESIRRLRDGATSALETSVICIAVTAPILASLALPTGLPGLIANPVILPWTGLVLLPASLIATLACLFGVPGAAWLLAGAERCASLTLRIVSSCAAGWPDNGPTLPPADWAVLLAGFAAIATLYSPRLLPRLALVFLIVIGLAAAPRRSEPEALPRIPRMLVFDVGQGDATLIQGRDAAILVDAGRSGPGRFDAGAQIVVPGLRALGVRRLDVVVASHADIDHRGGLVAVMRSVEVGALWLPRGGASDPSFSGLIDTARRRGIPIREVSRGAQVGAIGDLWVEVLWPPARPWGASRNDDSVVLRVTVEGTRLMLTGDAGQAAEARLVEANEALSAAVLKVGHHGSATASSSAFLRAVAPDLAIVPAACGGRAGLPSAAALARLEAVASEVAWTGRDGAIAVALGTEANGTVRGRPAAVALATRRRCVLH